MERNDFWDFLSRNMGKIVGVLAGLGIALLFLEYGFFKSLFILLCVGVGYYFGSARERRERFIDNVGRLINNRKDN